MIVCFGFRVEARPSSESCYHKEAGKIPAFLRPWDHVAGTGHSILFDLGT